jgi:hypothetical protein
VPDVRRSLTFVGDAVSTSGGSEGHEEVRLCLTSGTARPTNLYIQMFILRCQILAQNTWNLMST